MLREKRGGVKVGGGGGGGGGSWEMSAERYCSGVFALLLF